VEPSLLELLELPLETPLPAENTTLVLLPATQFFTALTPLPPVEQLADLTARLTAT